MVRQRRAQDLLGSPGIARRAQALGEPQDRFGGGRIALPEVIEDRRGFGITPGPLQQASVRVAQAIAGPGVVPMRFGEGAKRGEALAVALRAGGCLLGDDEGAQREVRAREAPVETLDGEDVRPRA